MTDQTNGYFMTTLNITRLSEHIGIPKRTLFDMIRDGRFPVEPIKGTQPRLWHIDRVNDWLKSQ